MAGWLIKSTAGLAALSALVIGVVFALKSAGLLSLIGIESESHDSQVIQAVQRTEEISLSSLHVQGIHEQRQRATTFLGVRVPGTERALFLRFGFTAKVGVDGAKVHVRKTGPNAFIISVPKFKFIGFDKQHFGVAVEKSGVLAWTTPDISQAQVIDKILNNPQARQKYIDSNRGLLKAQTKLFYRGLITSVDPTAHTTFQFSA